VEQQQIIQDQLNKDIRVVQVIVVLLHMVAEVVVVPAVLVEMDPHLLVDLVVMDYQQALLVLQPTLLAVVVAEEMMQELKRLVDWVEVEMVLNLVYLLLVEMELTPLEEVVEQEEVHIMQVVMVVPES
jgi:hypothetical protein